MRAVEVSRFGGPEVLRLVDLEPPSPISTEILVRVLAAGVNPVDCKTRRGEGVARWLGAPPFVVGWDVAGGRGARGCGGTRVRGRGFVVWGPPVPPAPGGDGGGWRAPSGGIVRAPER